MPEQVPIMLAGSQPETQPDNPPVDLQAQARKLAEDHKQHAQTPSGLHTGSPGAGRRSPDPTVLFSARLPHFASILKEATSRLQAQTSKAGQLSPAAEWLLDNHHIAAQALREVGQDLPPHYDRQLPRLPAGQPRVYDLSAEIIQTENALLDLGRIERFVAAYQEVLPLTMGELWALPTMLRLGILECLLAAAAQLTTLAGVPASELDPRLKALGQLNDQLIVENSIRSLRALAVHDWKHFFETLSLVEITLRQDPARLYTGMDFDTRDRYRKVVEEIARGGQAEELSIAREAMRLARNGAEQPEEYPGSALRGSPDAERNQALKDFQNGWDGYRSRPEAHVGYYLLGQGRPALEQAAGHIPKGREWMERYIRKHPTPIYLGSILGLALGLTVIALIPAAMAGASEAGLLVVLLLALVPALTIAVDLVNWMVTQFIKPEGLAHMDFSRGIPEECASMVVIPAMLSDRGEVDSLVGQLEQHYLRNSDPGLSFALLTDYMDSAAENDPGDSDLVERARQGIRALNEKYPRAESDPYTGGRFALLHRKREWNPSEDVWMGWERKRGKLHELNRLILAAQGISPDGYSLDEVSSFPIREGDQSMLQRVRYVITLDADTILPRDAARELIAALAHPLNRARLKPAETEGCGEEVGSGYTILQPRTDINPLSGGTSIFTRIFSGDTGLDLYTRAVSDVYQDLFGEGSYVGKGAYEVSTFERSLEGCIPENSLLSHDLFEGIHGRTALVTSTVLVEDMPPNYLAHTRRVHRWTRGDWQLLPWLLSPRLSAISRWKIVDNLRRSLVPLSLLVWFLAGWLGPFSPGIATAAGAAVLAVPLFTGFFGVLRSRLSGKPTRQAGASLVNSFFRWMLALVFLPYEAQVTTDAILRTLVRLGITRRGLLRWTTSYQVARRLVHRVVLATWVRLAFSPVLAIVLAVLISLLRPAALAWAAPLLAAWFLAPGIAIWVSRPLPKRTEELDSSQRQELRRLARRTWLFFEQFIGPEDQWLPPDHFQEAPLGVVAHRTSPTNIGLGLLSALGAYDLGYLEPLTLSTRLLSSFDTLEKLERYRGHFLNWYDTRSLEPLQPRYISTVDSGNLAACLLALRQGCLEVPVQPVLRRESFEGLLDAIDLLETVFHDLNTASLKPAIQGLRSTLSSIIQAIQSVKDGPARWADLLYDLGSNGNGRVSRRSWSDLDRLIVELVEKYALELGPENLRRLRYYNRGARQQLNSIQRCIDTLLPWLASFQDIPGIFRDEGLTSSVAEAWEALQAAFPGQPALAVIPATCRAGRLALERLKDSIKDQSGPDWEDARRWIHGLENTLDAGEKRAKELIASFEDLARRCDVLFEEMNFSFLFDAQRQVFHIGYNATTSELDLNYYDLLASEARLASLVAIAKGEVPQSHWLHLSRPFTYIDGRQALLSWSATMFEYLMPRLLVRSEPGTLLGQTMEVVVDQQIEYGLEKNVPWGISESGYYRFDASQFYQYRAFGVPGLGYKRGLADDLVITPYASLLALPLRPRAVLKNMGHLGRLGMMGMFGFYEAGDFTPVRLAADEQMALVRSYMAHHQGMIMLSLVNYLQGDAMVRRFQGDPRIQSVELLLLEQIPRDAPNERPNREGAQGGMQVLQPRNITRPWQVDPQAQQPRVHALSNGHYRLLITAAGGGYSAWGDIALTRWRPDTTLDNRGTWIFVQDQETRKTWSASLQPAMTAADEQEVFFNAHFVEFRRQDGLLAQTTQVFIAPHDDVEIRLVTLTNHGDQPRRLRLISYGEVVLAPQDADDRHPAFNKLFIASEPLPRGNGLLFHRRPRSRTEKDVYLAHTVVSGPAETTAVHPGLENDRNWFLGRGRTIRNPAALEAGTLRGPRPTLDPIFSISQGVTLPPHGTFRLAFLTAAAPTAEACQLIIDRYLSMGAIHTALEQARVLAEEEMNKLGISNAQLKDFQTLLSLLIFPSPALRASPERLAANQKGQPGLWPFAISGDYPILLAELGDAQDLALARELLQAHSYWRKHQLMIDLVFLDKQGTSYNQELSSQLYSLIAKMKSEGWINRRGGIFLLHADQMGEADRVLLETAARVVLDNAQGSLAEHLQHSPALEHKPSRLPLLSPTMPGGSDPQPDKPLPRPQDLLYDNGLGGFKPDGSEYCIYLAPGQVTPAPWVNVIANPNFGFMPSESGLGTSWAGNSGENRLSPWGNDPVSDEPGEALYLRDEETGMVWSPTPRPAPAPAPYLARHGAGYTIFEHNSHGLRQELRLFSPPDAPVKILQLHLENTRDQARRITATYYVEWVLGVIRESSQPYLIPEFNSDPQALLVRNPYNTEFSERVAFAAASNPLHSLTANRREFLGRLGSLEEPAALKRIGLEGTVEAGLDPCAALQLHIDMQPGASEQVYFLLGQAEDREAALALVRHYQDLQQVQAAWEANQRFWNDLLGTVQVQTPEPAFDLLINRWLLYQTLSCRIWGRTAFYQSSGAYGFRDQLQDVLALLHVAPELAREHLLRAARHQFEAGDVLHWWHPPSGRGVRTRISDDMLWLPYVTAEYVSITGDESILNEKVPFRRASLLERGQEERYGQYPETSGTYTLFEHCRRALGKGTTSGQHNLPLMGGGDWNDGMSRVGLEGRGESTWLGWFLYSTLNRFAALCERRGQDEPAADYRQRASDLAQAIEQGAWDGSWYLRAFYDDGTPLGSSEDQECRIDSLAQSWAVLSGGGDPQRAAQAMQSVYEQLVQRTQRLVLLFTPPFDKTSRDPGYIKGYPPGVRENGGQYTHAALWSAWAFLELRRIEEGFEIFQLLNPILQADTPQKAAQYRVEPYVVAGDVYGAPPFSGRGGWTWYTGSSGWMYRLGIEGFLGLKKRGDQLEVDPRIPREWTGFHITYRSGAATYEIEIQNPEHVSQGVQQLTLDGRSLPEKVIPLSREAGSHTVLVVMG